MTPKQRDVVFRRWSGAILRETQDLATLEQVGAPAANDSDVRDDPVLQGMIRGEIAERRNRIDQESQGQAQASSRITQESTPNTSTDSPEPTPPPTDATIREGFDRLSQALCASLERGDDRSTLSTLERLRTLQSESLGVIPIGAVEECERRVEELRQLVARLKERITASTGEGVDAARNGRETDLARSMRRLVAIHAAHPALLTETQLSDIRMSFVRATDERSQHQLTTRKLLERERAITVEIKELAAAVRTFHQAACTLSGSSEAFRQAEAVYLRTIRQVRTYDTEWFLGIVLELADLLAEWTLPPKEAKGQIERFLDSIHAGVERIRAEMREIESEQDAKETVAKSCKTP